jgi:hypothetical protein
VGGSVGAGVGGSVGLGAVGDAAGVSDASVPIAIESVSVNVALGVGGFTPELGVAVGSGDSRSYAGTLFIINEALMKTIRATAMKTNTMVQALTERPRRARDR